MIGKFQSLAVVAAIAFAFGGATGGSMAYKKGVADEQKETNRVKEASAKLLNLRIGERDQCHAEVAKINQANADQVLALLEEFKADQSRLERAIKASQRATERAAEQQSAATQTLLYAREKIQHAIDECTRAGVPDDIVSVLNDIAATAEIRDSDMSTTTDNSRP